MAQNYQINIQMPEDRRKKLEAAAKRAGLAVSTFIRIIVLEALGGSYAKQLDRAARQARELTGKTDGSG